MIPSASDRKAPATPSATPCVLIVEDSRTYAELLRRQLGHHLDFEVLVAANYQSAMRLADEHRERIFVAILDLNLPDAPDGQIVDAILGRGISAIVLTGTFDEKVRQQIVSKNIIDYVVKENVHDLDYIVQLIRRIRKNENTKVLVVDDSSTYRYVLRNNLAPYKYQILEAGNGREALELLQAHGDIQLVITDNQLPVMDGFELTSAIRKSFSKEEVAIIGLSAASGGALSARFLKRGANDFLTKPYSKEEFFCRVSQNIEITDLIREIKESSNRDYLTGLFNRRYFFDLGEKYFANAQRNHLELVVAMLDIDFFKAVNDSFGHEAGDAVISSVANLIAGNLRQTDILARFGGEEFCVLAINAGAEYAQVFERIRLAIAASEVEYQGNTIQVTLSAGVTGRLGKSLSDSVRHADELLYQAKERGRNRVVRDAEAAGASGRANRSPRA